MGEMGGLCPLFFDGAVCQFNELPRPDDGEGMKKVYEYLKRIRGISNISKSFFSYGIRKLNKRLYKWRIFHKFAAFSKQK